MTASRYTLIELWNDLEGNYRKFISINMIPVSNKEDEEAYELARKTIQEMINTGRAAEATNFWFHPWEKARLGLKTKYLFSENFGPEETPPVKGQKSLAFLNDVVLPHMEYCQKIQHEQWLIYLCKLVGMDLAAETLHAGELSARYKSIIAAANSLHESTRATMGDQFRFFSSSSAERVPAPASVSTPGTAAAVAVAAAVASPRPGV